MRTFAFIGLLAAGLSGCVVYEKGPADGDLRGDDPADLSGSADEGPEGALEDSGLDGEGALEDSGLDGASSAVLLDFYPSEVTQGERFIGYLSVLDGELELETVEGLRFYGDVELLSYDVRSDEVVISLGVADRAVTGEVDLLVDLGGGEALWLEGAFRIAEAGGGADTVGGEGASEAAAGCD